MSFQRTRKIKNNFYRYEETRTRVGGKVKSTSRYLGKADGHVPAVLEDACQDKFNAENQTAAGKALEGKDPTDDGEAES